MHPYHIVLHQELKAQDFDTRLNFCNWLLNMIEDDPELLTHILWSDEATFCCDGSVNLHNMHYWSEVNPHWMREVQHQARWSVNVWVGIIGGQIIGPFIFNATVNGERYLEFLIHELPPYLGDVLLAIRRDMFFQHNRSPTHYSRGFWTFLEQKYPDRWIGRGSIFN